MNLIRRLMIRRRQNQSLAEAARWRTENRAERTITALEAVAAATRSAHREETRLAPFVLDQWKYDVLRHLGYRDEHDAERPFASLPQSPIALLPETNELLLNTIANDWRLPSVRPDGVLPEVEQRRIPVPRGWQITPAVLPDGRTVHTLIRTAEEEETA